MIIPKIISIFLTIFLSIGIGLGATKATHAMQIKEALSDGEVSAFIAAELR
jgi:hypothetical protein